MGKQPFLCVSFGQLSIPDKRWHGRFAALRLVRTNVDFCVIVVYVPVAPTSRKAREEVQALWDYVASFLSKLPHRPNAKQISLQSLPDGVCQEEAHSKRAYAIVCHTVKLFQCHPKTKGLHHRPHLHQKDVVNIFSFPFPWSVSRAIGAVDGVAHLDKLRFRVPASCRQIPNCIC